MKKYLLEGFLYIVLLLGVFQFFLIPGIIWNLLLPVFLIFTVGYFFISKDKSIFKKICFSLLAVLFLFELGLIFYSNLNISDPNHSQEIKVMTYNLFFKNKSNNNSIKVIKTADPDILFVQELTPKWANILNEKLGHAYPFKLTIPLNGTHGIGIYSKYKLKNQQLLNNAINKPYAQVAQVSIGNKNIQLINTHLASPAIAIENKERFAALYNQNYQLRKEQLKSINKVSKKNPEKYQAHLIIGDLNTMKYEPLFKRLKMNWTNAHSVSGRGFGFNFPHSNRTIPFVTLDYILGKGDIEFIETKVLKGGGSDHLAIISKLNV